MTICRRYFRAEMTKIDVASLLIHMIDVTEVVEVTQSVAREKARASSMVHHEIGNLLSSASACLDRVKEKCDVAELGDLSASSYRGFCEAEFQSITTALCQSMEVIHNTNSITRLDDAMFVPPTEDFAIQSVGDELASLFRQNMAPGVKFVVVPFRSGSCCETLVCGPRFYLVRALSNLIGNAVKFTRSGSVTLRVSLVGPDVYEFEIADTGRGIAPDKLESIVQFGQQTCAADAQRGWGVGLALVVKIVARLAPPEWSPPRASSRNLEFDSVLGTGTTVSFRAWLPECVADEPQVSQLSVSAKAPPFDAFEAAGSNEAASVKLAVVCDDVAVIREAMVRMLERRLRPRERWKVGAAANGEDAIKRYPDADLVLMDFHMPITGGVLNGAEACERLLHLKPSMIVVGVTANAQQGSSEHEALLRAGCFAVQPKPVDPDAFLRLLYGHGAWSPAPRTVSHFFPHSSPRAPRSPTVPHSRMTSFSSNSSSGSPQSRARSLVKGQVLDLEQALKTFGDTASFLEQLPDFCADAPLDARIAAHTTEVCAKLKANAHAAKGAALTFGCARLGDACSQLEQACARVLQFVAATDLEARAVKSACAELLAQHATSVGLPLAAAVAAALLDGGSTDGNGAVVPTTARSASRDSFAELQRDSFAELRPLSPPPRCLDTVVSAAARLETGLLASSSPEPAPPLVCHLSLSKLSLVPSLAALVTPPPEPCSALEATWPVDALVVDDQRVVRAITKKRLERAGFRRVVAVESGAAAIAFMQSAQGKLVHVILMDKEMPDMDGVQTTRAIVCLHSGTRARRLTILGLTATADDSTVAAFLEAGAAGVLTKPLTDADIGVISTSATHR